MEGTRHKTVKRPVSADTVSTAGGAAAAAAPVHAAPAAAVAVTVAAAGAAVDPYDPFRNLLDESARDAFRRPWHRLERGLRLNRLRMFVEEMSPQCSFTAAEN